MTVRNLDPELETILAAIAGGGMFDDGVTFEQMRERFETTAPMMWDAGNLPVHRTEDRAIPGPAGELPIRVYTPVDSREPLPVLVYLHGGGFTIGSVETADPMSRYLARAGECVVVNVGFRLAPEHPFPAPLDDCFAALCWTAEHAAELGGDAGRLAVGGDASGATYATLCTMLAKDGGGPAIAFQLLLSPCTEFAEKYESRLAFADDALIPGDMVDALMDAYAPPEVDRTDWRLSPVRRPDLSGLPPAYLLAAEYDFLRDEEQAYAERLREAGVPVEYRCWPGTVHNFFSMHDHLGVAREAMLEASAALRRGLHRG
ncbi:MAG TPA: alpha/beta hydrolase [Acidimicrobiia bacterium]